MILVALKTACEYGNVDLTEEEKNLYISEMYNKSSKKNLLPVCYMPIRKK